jgi:hypothetical protein
MKLRAERGNTCPDNEVQSSSLRPLTWCVHETRERAAHDGLRKTVAACSCRQRGGETWAARPAYRRDDTVGQVT